MKMIIEEVSGKGLESLLGKKIAVWCECYIYAGELIGLNDTNILLKDGGIVYETGPLAESGFKDIQPLPSQWYVQINKIESFGEMS